MGRLKHENMLVYDLYLAGVKVGSLWPSCPVSIDDPLLVLRSLRLTESAAASMEAYMSCSVSLVRSIAPLTEITTSISWFFSIEGFLLTVSITSQRVTFLPTLDRALPIFSFTADLSASVSCSARTPTS